MVENKRVTGVATLPIGVITPCITGEGGPPLWFFLLCKGIIRPCLIGITNIAPDVIGNPMKSCYLLTMILRDVESRFFVVAQLDWKKNTRTSLIVTLVDVMRLFFKTAIARAIWWWFHWDIINVLIKHLPTIMHICDHLYHAKSDCHPCGPGMIAKLWCCTQRSRRLRHAKDWCQQARRLWHFWRRWKMCSLRCFECIKLPLMCQPDVSIKST